MISLSLLLTLASENGRRRPQVTAQGPRLNHKKTDCCLDNRLATCLCVSIAQEDVYSSEAIDSSILFSCIFFPGILVRENRWELEHWGTIDSLHWWINCEITSPYRGKEQVCFNSFIQTVSLWHDSISQSYRSKQSIFKRRKKEKLVWLLIKDLFISCFCKTLM